MEEQIDVLSRYTKRHIILSIVRMIFVIISIGIIRLCLKVNEIGGMTSTFQGLLCAVIIYILFFLIFYPINGIIKTIKIFKLNNEKRLKYIIINVVFIITYILDLVGLYYLYLVLFKGV